jgi:hypothetical protein
MGVKTSRPHGASTGNLLEGSAWLRSVVQLYQKRRHGVSGFDSFVIEPLVTDSDGVEHFRVSVSFRNSKGKPQQVFWVVKVAQRQQDHLIIATQEDKHVQLLNLEIRIYIEVLSDIGKFLSNKRNQRARYLLNLPDLIHHDRLQQNGNVQRYYFLTYYDLVWAMISHVCCKLQMSSRHRRLDRDQTMQPAQDLPHS